tara:strand:+ start:100 stop:2190 length:2091 start_codon:yes stop_codon:yes gene_type:complete
MALAKIVVEKRSTSGVLESITPIRIINSIVSRQGSRSVDTGEFTVSIKHDVAENDTIKYIQDIVDTEFLTAIYNFQANDMDESGNDLDGDDTHTVWAEPNDSGNQKRFRSNYSAKFDGTTGKKITVTHPAGSASRNIGKLDFSGQFDIVIWATSTSNASGSATATDATNKNILFSKLDNSATGSGIEIGAKFISTNQWAVYAKIKIGSVTTEITGSLPASDGAEGYYMGNSLPRLIRLRRGSDDKIVLTINGSDAGTYNSQVITGDLSNTSNMIIGSNHDDSSPFDGLIHQLRIYNGVALTENQIQIIHSSPPQPMTMKFMGRVYRIKDNMKEKQLSCKGSGKLLLQTNITTDILGSTKTGELATRTNNDTVFDAGQDIHEIVQSIIKRTDGDFKFYNNPSPNSLVGEFIAEGNFVSIVNVLALKDALTFFTFPRKVFVIEDHDGIGTDYVFEGATGSGYDISESGKNDSRTVNDIEVIGRLKTLPFKDTGIAGVAGTTYPLSHNPINLTVRKVSDDSIYTTYTYSFDKKTITINSGSVSTTAVYAEYWYEEITGSSALYYRRSDTNSITEHGRYSKKIYLPQFTNNQDFDSWSQIYVGSNAKIKDVNERVTIKSPFLINSLRENHKIDVINVKKFTSDTNGIKSDMIVKSIEWFYPEGKTIINCGEYDFDSFDYDKDTSESLSGLVSTLTKTKTA